MNENLAKLLEKFPFPDQPSEDPRLFCDILELRCSMIDLYFKGVQDGIESTAKRIIDLKGVAK